jgi:fatty-acyl-CoA synthase
LTLTGNAVSPSSYYKLIQPIVTIIITSSTTTMSPKHSSSDVPPDPVLSHANARPSHLAAIELSTSRRWTYAELDHDIQRIVALLTSEGVLPGDRVAVIAANSVYLLMLSQALLRIGAIFVPLNWRLSIPELEQLLDDCTPRLLYYDSNDMPSLPAGSVGRRMQDLPTDMQRVTPILTERPRTTRTARDPCMMLYTSGTSGKPKGVILTSAGLLASAINFSVLGEVDSSCVFLCDSPMFHVIGAVTQLWPPLLQGGTMAISSGFRAETTNDRLGDPALGVTHYFCVPQMADALRHAKNFDASRWKSLKALFTGGAPNPPARIHWWLDQGVRMVDGYGMTETGTTLGMPLSADVIRHKAGSVGFAGPLTHVRIVDASGTPVGPGVAGEIQVSGMNVTPGYWNRPEETERVFPSPGWFRTGDVGVRDADGYISIVDRLKDMFISGGENVYPAEVEAALVRHAGVRDVAVVGCPDKKWGEIGVAFIVLSDKRARATELHAHCRKLLAGYKVPARFVLVDDLPRTGSGKVLKHVLKAELVAKQNTGPAL